jgi:DNA polymerase elongation subunit (family B)
MFNVNFKNCPTLPSISFSIFRKKFLDENIKIPSIFGDIYKDIKQSYTGGYVDVYKPYNINNKNIYSYDVNSLYPYIMKHKPFPVGEPKYFEGSIYDIKNLFGFLYVKVKCPTSLDTPILQTKPIINGKISKSTISPVGTWEGWYFSEEIKNAIKHGYSFEIKKGYLFEKSTTVFKEFVDFFYNIKKNTPKSDPRYLISKLILNSLYGRFGMSPFMLNHLIINSKDFNKYHEKYSKNDELNNILDFNNGKMLISYEGSENLKLNISISIASAITAWSRIEMSKYIIKYQDIIICIDTDGIKLMGCMAKSEIHHNELGFMKHEGTYPMGVFLAPKVYGLVSKQEEIIKIKGVKNKDVFKNNIISFWQLNGLLYKDYKLRAEQERWFRNLQEGSIITNETEINISVTNNKRIVIYDCCGKFINTKPYILENGVIINNNNMKLYYIK